MENPCFFLVFSTNVNFPGGASPRRPPHVVGPGVRRRPVRSSSGQAQRPGPTTNARADDERPGRRRGRVWGGFAAPGKFTFVEKHGKNMDFFCTKPISHTWTLSIVPSGSYICPAVVFVYFSSTKVAETRCFNVFKDTIALRIIL